MTSLAVAQISEFSLIVTKFGHNLGHVHDEVLTTITLVGGITMTVSTYMIFNNDRLYAWLEKPLDIFGTFSDGHAADEFAHEDHPEIILFGCHRMGGSLLDFMKLQKARLLIVDYNLDTINKLKAKGYNAQYGDISYSDDMFEAFGLENAKIVISTIPSLKENKALLNYLEKLPNKPITCITTSNHYDFGELYKAGSDFVAYPHLISSELLAKIVHNGKLDTTLVKMREKHMNHLGANLAS
jgi:hypothetical protein